MKRWVIPVTVFTITLLAIIAIAPHIYAGLSKPIPAIPQDVIPEPITPAPANGTAENPGVTLPLANASTSGRPADADRGIAAGNASPIETEPPGTPATLLNAPDWKAGDWWIVRESRRNIAVAVADPPWSAPVNWTMTVAGISQYNGEPCFVINVTSDDRPDTWGQAYYNVSNLALKKAVFRYGPPSNVTVDVSAADIMSATGDVSLLAIPAFPANMTAGSYEVPAVPGESAMPDSLTAECYRINLMSHGRIAAWELWQPGTPWWLYLDCDSLKARLVDCSRWHGQGG